MSSVCARAEQKDETRGAEHLRVPMRTTQSVAMPRARSTPRSAESAPPALACATRKLGAHAPRPITNK
eukprot:3433696-Pleurochrysis_carterae.AAC.2